MLKATWPHHFGNIATPQLWQEVHELLQANEEQPERELIFLNHDRGLLQQHSPGRHHPKRALSYRRVLQRQQRHPSNRPPQQT